MCYTYDDNDRLSREITGGLVTEYRYDPAGNLRTTIQEGETTAQYVWNSKGQLIQAVVDDKGTAQTIDFAYNTNGIRVERTVDGETTRFLIDTNQQEYAQVIEAYSPGEAAGFVYTFGNDLLKQQQNDAGFFYHTDGLGSTWLMTDEMGGVANRYIYDAYGNAIARDEIAQNAFQFTGEQFDPELEQYYLRARYYDPATGRFISRDPFEGFLELPLSLNKYGYVEGNPINAIDPSGLISSITTARIANFALTFTNTLKATLFAEITCKVVFKSENDELIEDIFLAPAILSGLALFSKVVSLKNVGLSALGGFLVTSADCAL